MFIYYKRQEQLIEEGLVEVFYMAHKRRGCAAVMAYEYYKTIAGAERRAKTIAAEYGKALVTDFAGGTIKCFNENT